MRQGQFKVSFEPDGKEVYCLPGTSLTEASGMAGIIIDLPCGGQGKCGKCGVEIENAPRATREELSVLKEDEIKKGVRLACQSKINHDLLVKIPLTSRISSQKIIHEGLEERKEIKPSLWKVYTELDLPILGDGLSDLDRIKKKVSPFSCEIYLIRKLPHVIRESNFKVTCVLSDSELISVEPGDTTDKNLGLAFDMGTTTVVGSLVNLNTGEDLAVVSCMNPQSRYGDDVVSRITFASQSKTNLEKLHHQIIATVNELTEKLTKEAGVSNLNIYKMAVVGNTAMQHIFCCIDPSSLGTLPFNPVIREKLTVKAKKLGVDIADDGIIYVFPCIGGFVGGDTVSVILATGMYTSEKIKLAIDIGTNGEIVLGNKDRLICASTAAGPAFEGARISQGMRACAGAIEKVIIDEEILLNTIGNIDPLGICGSGLIDAAAGLLNSGIIDSRGKILQQDELKGKVSEKLRRRIVLREGSNVFRLFSKCRETQKDIFITQRDIRELQLAKAAISAGIKLLIREYGIKHEDIEEILLAGAFGNYIRRSNAKRIGLIPELPSERIRFIGNAASSGAKLALLSKDLEKEAEELFRVVEHIQLSTNKDFQSEFADAMFFPE